MGAWKHTPRALRRALYEMGAEVTVATCNTHGLAARERENGVNVVRFPCKPLLGGRFPLVKNDEEAKRLWTHLEDEHFDYVIANTRFYTLTERALDFATRAGVVPLLIEHGSAHLTMGSTLIDPVVQAVEHALTKRDLRYPFVAYAVSRKASAWLGHFGIESAGELPNSIDADAYVAQASRAGLSCRAGHSHRCPHGRLRGASRSRKRRG